MRSAETVDFTDLDLSTLDLPIIGEGILRDARVPDLGLRLRSGGSRTWVHFEKRAGKTTRHTLGDATSIPLKSARLMASAVSEPPETSSEPDAKPARFLPDARVDEVMTGYLAFGAQGRWKASTGRQMASIVRTSILPSLGAREVRDITQQEVARWHLDVSARTTSARMALSTLSGMMLYAEDHGLRPAGSNPCRSLRKKEVSTRGRQLPAATVSRLWQALDRLQNRMPDACDAVRLLFLTGARRSEILGLRWDCLSGPRAVLADSKTGPHVVWLNALARAVLDRRAEAASGPFVFPAPKRKGPMTVIDRQWRAILKEAKITGLRVHDLRHHFASVAVSNGIDLRVVGQLLGHRDIDSTLGYAHLATETLVKSASRVSARIDHSLAGCKTGEPSPRRKAKTVSPVSGKEVRHG
ncbi:tyrosine-type recombinase/integrase [Sphingobium sp. AN558]|uniref:tyrosine-type recombinase/integrase n=1 Tax=Sphingobium sp. AN558 TaxID=3133442 RepID=UPI0030BFB86F